MAVEQEIPSNKVATLTVQQMIGEPEPEHYIIQLHPVKLHELGGCSIFQLTNNATGLEELCVLRSLSFEELLSEHLDIESAYLSPRLIERLEVHVGDTISCRAIPVARTVHVRPFVDTLDSYSGDFTTDFSLGLIAKEFNRQGKRIIDRTERHGRTFVIDNGRERVEFRVVDTDPPVPVCLFLPSSNIAVNPVLIERDIEISCGEVAGELRTEYLKISFFSGFSHKSHISSLPGSLTIEKQNISEICFSKLKEKANFLKRINDCSYSWKSLQANYQLFHGSRKPDIL